MSNKKEIKKISFGLILGWFFGILFFFGTFNNLVGFNFKIALIFLIMGLAVFPPLIKIYKKKFNFEISSGLKIVTVIVGFFLVFFFTFTSLLSNFNSQNNYEYSNQYLETYPKNNSNEDSYYSEPAYNPENQLKDIFDSSEYKSTINSNENKLNCDSSSNYGKELISFKVHYRCRQGEDSTLLVDNDECELFGGKLTSHIDLESYPSLKEYHFNYIVYKFENYGCTKIKDEGNKIIYALYQNETLIKIKIDESIIKNSLSVKEGNLYPKDYFFAWLNFQEFGEYTKPLVLTNPTNLVFKSCILSNDNQIIACDELNFNFD